MKTILTILTAGFVCISCGSKKEKNGNQELTIETHVDSVSYAIGLDVAMRLDQQYKDINYKLLGLGIDDYFSKNEQRLTDRERLAAIKEFNDITLPKYRMDLEKQNTIEGNQFFKANADNKGVIEHRSGIQYKILKEGKGPKPKPKDQVKIHYIGKLIDGSTFDSSYSRGKLAVFQVNRVVPGFSQGLQLMNPGAKYQLFIPGHLGYGSSDGPGGPMAFMIFQVELIEIIPAPEPVD
ncbi:MAG: FKBP-type peptidyl-prolyl cis-trans isomerase [Candidatus Marinimicrobia bacterium]|jgi:FKBP-type peptidyl-prolyl cis-trans isomerase|nr:FKBP-type peptidyl-prolyl cis-trans isomerase [Candidatus Neomarinimicrobiota bacterium]MDP6611061.1 FKBP-type peptidyl-prolyl cis-trans isomerase [Candidatus Neomarinimicrobiota bacterium]|tara:strand:- start:33884 stop:34594 length:711 start_codon:yes stop_codon:yes gene_type:complete